ncbi:MAG: hypothetical protein EAZ21_08245 [Betaproteobacteria bacterium]|nr:MAG: hypothetical protein EAZ21_08245 [Betaproteobacteria bacterium]
MTSDLSAHAVIPAKAGTQPLKSMFSRLGLELRDCPDWVPARRFIPAQAGTGMTDCDAVAQ